MIQLFYLRKQVCLAPSFYRFGERKCDDRCFCDILISAAVMVILCQGDVSRSRVFKVKREPFSEWILKIRSISVCRSIEYLPENRLVKSWGWLKITRFLFLLFLKTLEHFHNKMTKTFNVNCLCPSWIFSSSNFYV